MRIEREVKQEDGVRRECTSIQFGKTDLGPGSLCVERAVELRMQITDQLGTVLVTGRLESIHREEDGTIRLDFVPVTWMS